MKSLRFVKDKKIENNIIKDERVLFRLKKEINYTSIKDIKNLCRLKKENEAIENSVIREIRNLYEHEDKNYYKPVRVGNFWSNNYTEYKSNGDKNKALSIEDCFNKIKPYLKNIINDLKKSDTWKILY